MCIHRADSLCCRAETGTTLPSNYPQGKRKKRVLCWQRGFELTREAWRLGQQVADLCKDPAESLIGVTDSGDWDEFRVCLIGIEMRVQESIEDDIWVSKLDSWVLFSEIRDTGEQFQLSLEAVSYMRESCFSVVPGMPTEWPETAKSHCFFACETGYS